MDLSELGGTMRINNPSLIGVITLLSLSMMQSAAAPVPYPQSSVSEPANMSGLRLVKFSNTLKDSLRQPIQGPVGVTFGIYRDQEGGAPLWLEVQNVQADAQGNYTVLLGSTTGEGIPSELFSSNEPRWLGVQANLPGNEEQPRLLFVSVPYAVKAADADTLGGKPASSYVLADPGLASESGSGSDRHVPSRMNATVADAGFIPKFLANGVDLGASSIFDKNGNIGIGTVNPITRLQVSGGLRVTDRGDNCCSQFIQSEQSFETHFYTNSSGHFQIHKYGPSSLGGSAFTITNSGNVGIGTSNPIARLQVSGGPLRITDRGDNCCSQLVQAAGSFETHFYTTSAGDFQIHKYGSGSLAGVALAITNAGNIGVGTPSPSARLHVAGNATVDGNIGAKYQDVAEWVEACVPLPPGTVVVIENQHAGHVRASDSSYDTTVVGAVSPQPGLILGEAGPNKLMIAQSGRVRIRVDATYGAIRAGDLLVTSPTKGHAMRSEPVTLSGMEIHRPGTLLGKALEPLSEGVGEILVLLTLQ